MNKEQFEQARNEPRTLTLPRRQMELLVGRFQASSWDREQRAIMAQIEAQILDCVPVTYNE